jgi:hypothetical protein
MVPKLIASAAVPLYRLSTFCVVLSLAALHSCSDQKERSANISEERDKSVSDLETGPPSDRVVQHAGWTIAPELINSTFKRGEVLEALGGAIIPAGTPLYPIKFEDFPAPLYLSQDEFGAWRFTVGKSNSLIPVRRPETPDEKKAREAKERAKLKAESDLWNAGEGARQAEQEARNRTEKDRVAREERLIAQSKEEALLREEQHRVQEAKARLDSAAQTAKTHQAIEDYGRHQENENDARDLRLAAELEKNRNSIAGGTDQSGTIAETGDISSDSSEGPPSAPVIEQVARLLKIEDSSHRRGQLLESTGTVIPKGTVIYPIKFNRFPRGIYLNRDEFGDWKFMIEGSDRLIALPEPETPEEEASRLKRQVETEQQKKAQQQEEENTRKESVPKTAAGAVPGDSDGNSDRQSSSRNDVSILEAKRKLSELDQKIESERSRWFQASEVIDRLTNFKRSPVKEGSAAYYQCLEASKIIQDVESKAPSLKAERVTLEKMIIVPNP